MSDTDLIRNTEQSYELTIPELASRMDKLRDVMRSVMREGEDFGTIPGAGTRKVLHQPGGEKLAMLFRFAPAYDIDRIDLPEGHREYSVTCRLTHIPTQAFVGSATASCTSLEPKYRYRGGSRVCPECGKATIKKSKFPPRGAPPNTPPGFYCYAKIGGCGQEFAPNDPGIVNQSEEKQENPDIAGEFNTVCQMAQKRAFLRAIRTATASSELFTQDIEEPVQDEPPPSPAQKPTTKTDDVFTKAKAAIAQSATELQLIDIGTLTDTRRSEGKLTESQHLELVAMVNERLKAFQPQGDQDAKI